MRSAKTRIGDACVVNSLFLKVVILWDGEKRSGEAPDGKNKKNEKIIKIFFCRVICAKNSIFFGQVVLAKNSIFLKIVNSLRRENVDISLTIAIWRLLLRLRKPESKKYGGGPSGFST